MGLAEKLAARANARGATAQVTCGELGTVTVEALPLRELELLSRGPDGARKVFYAACRELQAAGEEMRREGKLYTPDGILQYVSDEEAQAAARTVLGLSGLTAQNNVDRSSNYASDVCDLTRLFFVQEKAGADGAKTAEDMEQNRLVSVQFDGVDSPLQDEVRLSPVQFDGGIPSGFGQVSRETGAKFEDYPKVPESDNKTPSVGEFLPEGAQNVVDEENFVEVSDGRRSKTATALHEIKSEPAGALHEIKSDFVGDSRSRLHENESEFSEIRVDTLHETESDFGKSLHESKSESPEMLHEIESEMAERAARHLLEGLQRAKWVRGG